MEHVTSVFIADSAEDFCLGLSAALQRADGFQVVGTANDGEQAIRMIAEKKPDVVVLHDTEGEYGHTAHMAFCWLGQQGVERAADPAEHPASAAEWGVWNVPKTYIHLYPENQLRMDWHQPLSAFGGKTGLQVAAEAFLCHATQQERWQVQDGGEWDNALFGLWRTTVGPDTVKTDLFENIPAE